MSDETDGIGQRIHVALAIAYLLLLPLATSGKEFAWGLLAAYTLFRAPVNWRSTLTLARNPVMWLLVAWTVWRGASILWSPEPAQGLDEWGAFRVILTPLLLWPVLDRAPWLIAALLAGVFGSNLVQAAQYLHWFGLSPGVNDRLDGWLHAIHTGAFCVAAMCWHLSAILHGRWRTPALMVAAFIALAAATLGLVFSGSRGPWIAAAIAAPLCIVVIAVRRPAARRTAAVAVAAGVLGGLVTWPLYGDLVTQRVAQATTEVAEAWGEPGKYNSDVGQRLARWSAAWKTAKQRPLIGAGGGGYGAAAQELGYGHLTRRDHDAHSLYLHELATIGLPGLLLVLGLAVLSMRQALSAPPGNRYADGTAFVLLGWLIGALFGSYQVSGTMFGLFTVAVCLTLPRDGDASV